VVVKRSATGLAPATLLFIQNEDKLNATIAIFDFSLTVQIIEEKEHAAPLEIFVSLTLPVSQYHSLHLHLHLHSHP
jgi:hypothetical protein